MSERNVFVSDIADEAKAAIREKDTTQQRLQQSTVAQMCENFITVREDQWITEVERYNMDKLLVLYNLLPSTSGFDENTVDMSIAAKNKLLHRMQKKVHKMRQSEGWTQNSPKDHYYVLNVPIGEVRPATLRAA
jgi:hypothetical protein